MAEEASGSIFGPGDNAMDRAIATRRAMEAARLQRIKDPKSRIMGIDTDALAAQIAEKEATAAAEKQLAAAYDTQRLQQDAQLAYLEQERLRAERTKLQYVDQFRKAEQGKERAREYDLNDPLALKKDLPGRMGDTDMRLTVSGMQQFHGEDLSYAHRIKVQQQEIKSWSDEVRAAHHPPAPAAALQSALVEPSRLRFLQIVAAKAARAAQDKAMDDAFAARAIEIDHMKTALEATSRQARSANNVAVAEYNLAQAAAKREREQAAQKAELQDNVEEIQNALASDALTENPALGRSFIAPNRLRPDHYKGMSPAEQQDILKVQELQRQHKLEQAAHAKAQARAEDAMMESMRQQGAYQDAQVAAMRADMRKKLMDQNTDIAAQQFATKSFLKANVYTNAIDASFFDQFGTTSR